jgi:diguanylate cyclase (GGDEF)-like protein
MGTILGIGFVTGGFLGLGALLLPVPDTMDVSAIAAIAAFGLVVGAVCLGFRARLPLWTYHLFAFGGCVAITLSIVANGDPAANNELYYLYGAGFTFYYFAWFEASGYALLSLTLYTWAETSISEGRLEPTSLLVFAGCLVLSGALLRYVGTTSRRLASELERQATTDELTGLLNRRGLQRIVDGEMARALRTGRPFSLLIGDLDRFKSVNDKLGHMGGDMALERVAAGLGAERREIDWVARLGGEEFAVMMPETDSENARIAAERFRGSISTAFRGRPIELTMSIGVATYPTDGESWEQLLDAADAALYEAKDRGRDQVVVFDGEDLGQTIN